MRQPATGGQPCLESDAPAPGGKLVSKPAYRFGHHFLIGLQPSPVLTEHDRELLGLLRPLGIVLFRHNFLHDAPYPQWSQALGSLLDDVRSCVNRQQIIVAMDHEGGRVQRPPPPITHFSYARQWAHRAGQVGRAMGVELRSLGVNLNFAPVLDVDSNPANPVIGPRALGPDAGKVAMSGLDFMDALEAEGVTACPKHFPGHGDTRVDSHYDLPVIDHDPDLLRRRELVPFRTAVTAGARIIMTAHILFPGLDSRFPATLSPRVINGLLRRELGFQGVVTTDDIGMGAARDLFRQPEAARQLLDAGADLICLCAFGADTKQALEIAASIAAGHRSGLISTATLKASEERIFRFRESVACHRTTLLDVECLARHSRLAPLHNQTRSAGMERGTWTKEG